MLVYEYRPKRVFLGRLTKGEDVLEVLENIFIRPRAGADAGLRALG